MTFLSTGRLPVSIVDIKYDSNEDPFQLVYARHQVFTKNQYKPLHCCVCL